MKTKLSRICISELTCSIVVGKVTNHLFVIFSKPVTLINHPQDSRAELKIGRHTVQIQRIPLQDPENLKLNIHFDSEVVKSLLTALDHYDTAGKVSFFNSQLQFAA